jgi:hypothetical protein
VARFYGKVGYGETVDQGDGVHEDVIIERSYSGDVIRNSRNLDGAEKVNDDLSVSNSISIVADPYANEHFFAIRYVEWAGSRWKVSNVEVQRPRLILRLGGIYNGPSPVVEPSP